MNKSKVLRNFPNQPFPLTIKRAKGIYLFTKNGRRIMDLTGGCNSHAIIGYCHPQVIKALNKQAKLFTHIDYKSWTDENLFKLSNILCSKTKHGLKEIEQLDNLGQDWKEKDLNSVQGRICKPNEVASAVLYLASDESSFVNGNAFYIDNGWYSKG